MASVAAVSGASILHPPRKGLSASLLPWPTQLAHGPRRFLPLSWADPSSKRSERLDRCADFDTTRCARSEALTRKARRSYSRRTRLRGGRTAIRGNQGYDDGTVGNGLATDSREDEEEDR